MALSNLYFLWNYNPYYNREIKYEKTIDDYINAVNATTRMFGYNFNIADQVNASIIINVDEVAANYLIVEDQAAPKIIHSRWFIIESVWKRENQWQLTLRRDLVADYLQPFLQSTVYVEKGFVRQNTESITSMNPLVFNQESFTANQIKKKETLLKDKLGCKWVVGYLNKNAILADKDKDYKAIKTWTNKSATPDYLVDSLSRTPIGAFLGRTARYPVAIYGKFDLKYNTQLKNTYRRYSVGETAHSSQKIGSNEYKGTITTPAITPILPEGLQNVPTIDNRINGYYDMLYAAGAKESYSADPYTWQSAFSSNNRIIYLSQQDGDYAPGYYKISTKKVYIETQTDYNVDPDIDTTWYNVMGNYVTGKSAGNISYSKSGLNFRVTVRWSVGLQVALTPLTNKGYYTEIYPNEMNQTVNEAFDAFAIPVLDDEDLGIFIQGVLANDNTFSISSNFDSQAAFAVGQELTDVDNEALDLQLLPYCPLPTSWVGTIDPGIPGIYPQGKQHQAWNLILDENNSPVNIVFFLSSTEFSFNIPIEDPCDYSSIEEIKAINQCDTWRLYSGDYSSSFEFNVARNGGLAYFEVDCKYKPYQPYIHVAPNFGGLYGQDYNDTRGLVCSNTNFSLPRLTSAWENYERNNLNYMNAFNRQIENMDINRKYQKVSEWAQLAGGAATGISSGAAIGSIGGAPGAIIGGIVGGVTSAGAGLGDMWVNEQLYKENKQYAIDQFNMSLQNIQALPNTLAAVGAQNPNNKVFPVLCFYSCSDVEREAFKKKIKWDGMTIGVVSENITDYINPDAKTYFKGQLVYFSQAAIFAGDEDRRIDTHELSELANEIAKGILIDKGVIS